MRSFAHVQSSLIIRRSPPDFVNSSCLVADPIKLIFAVKLECVTKWKKSLLIKWHYLSSKNGKILNQQSFMLFTITSYTSSIYIGKCFVQKMIIRIDQNSNSVFLYIKNATLPGQKWVYNHLIRNVWLSLVTQAILTPTLILLFNYIMIICQFLVTYFYLPR